jgi:tetratricopeptide (TPR) repeat protein
MDPSPHPDTAETLVEGRPPGGPLAPAPERIGAYRIEGRLGLGGMGEVLLAWDERLERRVAIKRIRQEAGLTTEQRERFRLEARLAARLSHSAVVQIYDLVSTGAEDVIVMEYVEGRTLADRLAAGERMETAEVLRLAGEIAEGLAAAHEAGLIHRDLKAANIMVTPSVHAKILDFGLARPVIRKASELAITRQGMVLGTCHAMSPEQARGEEVDERSDLFSFGALIHEMLTGRPPFRGNDTIDSLRRVVTEEPVDPILARPDLPAEAARLLRRLLAKRREDRPAKAREVIAILESLRTHSGSQAALLEEIAGGVYGGAETQVEPPVALFPLRRLVPLVAAVALLALLLGMQGVRRLVVFDVRAEDYLTYMEIRKEIDRGDGAVNLATRMAQIQNILKRNPEFLEAWILGARVSRGLFVDRRETGDRDNAETYIREARRLAPGDPDPLIEELRLACALHDTRRAEGALTQLGALLTPARLLPLQALVAEEGGDLTEAADLLSEVVKQRPDSWYARYRLASVEARRGHLDEARRLFTEILGKSPDNVLTLQYLGWLELWHGDLERAAEIFTRLTNTTKAPELAWNNLGTVRTRQGKLQSAAEAFRRVLDIQPGYAPALANLAEVELDLGRRGEAEKHYRSALESLEKLGHDNQLSLPEGLLKAQCLARLDEVQPALAIARSASAQVANRPAQLVQIALVYNISGDREATLAAIKAARAKGVSDRWFQGPEFQWLRDTP